MTGVPGIGPAISGIVSGMAGSSPLGAGLSALSSGDGIGDVAKAAIGGTPFGKLVNGVSGAVNGSSDSADAASPSAQMTAAPTVDTSPFANAAAQTTPVAPTTTPDTQATSTPAPTVAQPAPYVDPQVVTGAAAKAPTVNPTPEPIVPTSQGDTGSDMTAAYRNGISTNESGGNYKLVGNATNGDRPYGKYGIMGANVPQWTKDALGTSMTPEQFLANPAAQDATFDHRFGNYVTKYGPEGAAQAWLGGEGSVGKLDRKDNLGTSVGAYGQKFMNTLSGGTPAAVGNEDQQGDSMKGSSLPQGPSDDQRAAAAIAALPGGQTAPAASPAPTGPWQKVGEAFAKLHGGNQGQAGMQAPAVQPSQSVDLGAQDVAAAGNAALQRSAAGNQNAAQRKQTLEARVRGQKIV